MKILLLCALLLNISSSTYDRKDWISSSSWTKARNRTLARDRIENYWICKYSSVKIKKKSEVDIDHIIPLKYAHDHCGDVLPEQKKRQLATDNDNLVSTSRHENRSKGDDGILEYMPSDNQCWYIQQWDIVYRRYGLCLTEKEIKYINNGIKACKIR